MTNTNLWTRLCTPETPYGLDRLRDLLAHFAVVGMFAPEHPDYEVVTMRTLSARAGSPTAARLGFTSSARTVAIRALLERECKRLYHPQLIDLWSGWLSSDDYRINYEAAGKMVDPIAPIASADVVALIRLGSDLDLEVSARTAELPIAHHAPETDLGRRLRIAGMADALSLIAHTTGDQPGL